MDSKLKKFLNRSIALNGFAPLRIGSVVAGLNPNSSGLDLELQVRSNRIKSNILFFSLDMGLIILVQLKSESNPNPFFQIYAIDEGWEVVGQGRGGRGRWALDSELTRTTGGSLGDWTRHRWWGGYHGDLVEEAATEEWWSGGSIWWYYEGGGGGVGGNWHWDWDFIVFWKRKKLELLWLTERKRKKKGKNALLKKGRRRRRDKIMGILRLFIFLSFFKLFPISIFSFPFFFLFRYFFLCFCFSFLSLSLSILNWTSLFFLTFLSQK